MFPALEVSVLHSFFIVPDYSTSKALHHSVFVSFSKSNKKTKPFIKFFFKFANFWNEELKEKGFNIKEMKADQFLNMYSKAKLTNAETIRRNRAKLQEEYPELRGEIYKIRQGKEQDKWREELGYHIKGINKL